MMSLRRLTRPRGFGIRLRRLLCDRRGGPAMEFAIIAPILVVCLTFVFDLGSALQQRIRLAEAVRAGGLYAVSYPTDTTNAVNATKISAAVTAAVPDWTDLTVSTPAMTCQCWNRTTFVFTTVDCPSTSSCAAGSELRRYITISASRPFSPVLMTSINSVAFSHVVRFQ